MTPSLGLPAGNVITKSTRGCTPSLLAIELHARGPPDRPAPSGGTRDGVSATARVREQRAATHAY